MVGPIAGAKGHGEREESPEPNRCLCLSASLVSTIVNANRDQHAPPRRHSNKSLQAPAIAIIEPRSWGERARQSREQRKPGTGSWRSCSAVNEEHAA